MPSCVFYEQIPEAKIPLFPEIYFSIRKIAPQLIKITSSCSLRKHVYNSIYSETIYESCYVSIKRYYELLSRHLIPVIHPFNSETQQLKRAKF